jgi:hypothetical protein
MYQPLAASMKKMKILKIITFLILLFTCKIGFGQVDTLLVNGSIIAENRYPISYLNIVLKGTNHGAMTGLCGEFELKIPKDFNGNIVISAVYPRVWEFPVKNIKGKSFVTIILNQTKGHKNLKCDKKIEVKNKIWIE